MAQRFDLTVAKKYTVDGEEKTSWKNVGSAVYFEATGDKPAGLIVELNMFPGVDLKGFVPKPKSDAPVLPSYSDTTVGEEHIPF
jgi:hypothetical protein